MLKRTDVGKVVIYRGGEWIFESITVDGKFAVLRARYGKKITYQRLSQTLAYVYDDYRI